MSLKKKILLAFAALILVSCEKNIEREKVEFEIISQSDLKFDLVFPQELWDQILRMAPPNIKIDKTAYELFEALELQVELVDSPKEVLGGRNYRFEFKDFGGEIDFNTYLKREAIGSFRMYFNFPKIEEDSEMKVLFLSWSKQYTRDEEVFGNGCGYFYDVSTYFKKEVMKNGLLLHTNNYRYLDLAAGRFYIVNYTKHKIKIAQVTLTDSSLEKRLCGDRP